MFTILLLIIILKKYNNILLLNKYFWLCYVCLVFTVYVIHHNVYTLSLHFNNILVPYNIHLNIHYDSPSILSPLLSFNNEFTQILIFEISMYI